MDASFFINLFQSGVRMAAPLILVSIGSVYAERSGVLYVGMEGSMLAGAFISVAVSLFTGNIVLAAISAMVVGGLLALVHAFITVSRRGGQIATGIGVNFLALGLTNFAYARLFPTQRVRVATFPILSPPALRSVPVLGPVIFAQPVIVWIALILPLVSTWFLYRTNWGLNIRAVGEDPHAVASAGLSVFRLKYLAVILGGVFPGLAGCALTLGELGYFAPNITGGLAWIVLAADNVGKWNPIMVAGACLLFGATDALQMRFQTLGSAIPYQFLLMTPYLLTLIVLFGLTGRAAFGPKTLGLPYDPEEI
jgi:ABC-type uncharacterized transport system permease subunit